MFTILNLKKQVIGLVVMVGLVAPVQLDASALQVIKDYKFTLGVGAAALTVTTAQAFALYKQEAGQNWSYLGFLKAYPNIMQRVFMSGRKFQRDNRIFCMTTKLAIPMLAAAAYADMHLINAAEPEKPGAQNAHQVGNGPVNIQGNQWQPGVIKSNTKEYSMQNGDCDGCPICFGETDNCPFKCGHKCCQDCFHQISVVRESINRAPEFVALRTILSQPLGREDDGITNQFLEFMVNNEGCFRTDDELLPAYIAKNFIDIHGYLVFTEQQVINILGQLKIEVNKGEAKCPICRA